jgi:hypothetical protein
MTDGKRCFVLMPFDSALMPAYESIKKVAASLDIECTRADEIYMAGSVVRMIVDSIKAADIIVADLTGRNPNVFYETALAHSVKEPRQVILIAQTDNDVPFDLRPLRYLRYSVASPDTRQVFETTLARFMEQSITAPSSTLFESINDALERTRRIVAECDACLNIGPKATRALTIRVYATLSSLAIDEDYSPELGEYSKLLIDERERISQLISLGAEFRAILSPPWEATPQQSYLAGRFQRLIRVVESYERFGADTLRKCKFVLSPFRSNNILMFGTSVYYEGYKMHFGRGYTLSNRVTDATLVAAQAEAFERMFADAEGYTLDRYNPGFGAPPAERLRQAVAKGLRLAQSRCFASATSSGA